MAGTCEDLTIEENMALAQRRGTFRRLSRAVKAEMRDNFRERLSSAMILLGMAISNGLVGLAGALFVQTQGGSDISMGIGTIVIGLAAVIVGESILPSRRIVWATLAVVVGAIVYRFFIAAALNSDFIGLKAQDLNLVTALLVTVALVIPQLKRKFAQRK